MTGPPPKPRDIRQRKHARPELAALPPRSELGVPDPPSGLLKATRDLWITYWHSPVASAALAIDLAGLHRWIQAVDEHTRAIKALRKARTVEGSTGQIRMNPLAGYAAALAREIKALEEQFGLNPQARLKLGISTAQARMTAQQLNATLEEHDDSDPDPILAEYEEAQ